VLESSRIEGDIGRHISSILPAAVWRNTSFENSERLGVSSELTTNRTNKGAGINTGFHRKVEEVK
jgi:hypothetical protein